MKKLMRFASRDSDNSRTSFRSKKSDKTVKKVDGYGVLYLGFATLTDARAVNEVPRAIENVKTSTVDQINAHISFQGNHLNVNDGDHQVILSSPLINISQCVQHSQKGFNDCFGLAFNSGPWIKQCHIFQAKSDKEASDIVTSIHKNIKRTIKNLRRKTEIPLIPSPLLGQDRLTKRRKSDGGIGSIETSLISSITPIPVGGQKSDTESSSYTPSVKASPWKRKKDLIVKDFGRNEKIEMISQIRYLIKESNTYLRHSCNNPHPQSPFERALHAINYSSNTLLSHLLDQRMLSVNSCDVDGNTLLHYAVAMRNIDAIDILCEKSSSVEHPCKSKLRPLHRAVIDGDKNIMIALLEKGANPNTQDNEKNTPLHYAASQKDQHESCWLLLQYGAMIMRQNFKGIRPIDLLPDLKEMQNRLIGSMCKSFYEQKEKVNSPLMSPSMAYNIDLQYGGNKSFSELLDRVKEQARLLKSKLRKNRFRKISHSISNLSELLEAEEDEMNRQDRLEKLQYPLLLEYPRDYFELDMQKDEVEKRLNTLIRHSKTSKNPLKRSTSDPEISSMVGDDSTSYEEKNFSENFRQLLERFEVDIPPPRPFSSPRPFTPRSPTTSKTAASLPNALSEAFDRLQLDLENSSQTPPVSSKKEEKVKISPRSTHKIKLNDSYSPQELKSKDEAMALLDGYISQIMTAAGELKDVHSRQRNNNDVNMKNGLSAIDTLHEESSSARCESPVYQPRKRKQSGVTAESSSSSDTKRNLIQDQQKRGHRRMDSAGSIGSNSSMSSSIAYNSHHGSLLTFNINTGDFSEPGSQSLKILVLLSRNPECAQTLISHICLSEFKERLLTCATSEESSLSLISNIASLVQNIFETGGPDGRKTAIESGMMDIVLKLLTARDPIPGTCLMILNSLLVSDDDNDYLRTIVKIPCDPLLGFLETHESDIDSGLGLNRNTSLSSNSDNPQSDEAKHHLYLPPLAKERAISLTSESSSTHTGATPTLHGHLVSSLEARRIVLKMLAVSSTHSKMQLSLSNPRCIGLLTECIGDVSQENKTNAMMTIANIAQNINSHSYLETLGLADKVRGLLTNGPRPRYQALRTLVYLGQLQLYGFSLFDPLSHGGYETDTLIKAVDTHGHIYVRGVTIEAAIELLTSNPRQLWGGIPLKDTATGNHYLSKEKTIDFFLTTYRSFLHPLILMRLLMHRLDYPGIDPSPFNWSIDTTEIHHTQIHSIPPVHQSVLNIIGQWIESHPNDFNNLPQLQDYISDLVHRLRKSRGVYMPHGHRLKSLMHDLQHPARRPTNNATSGPPNPRDKIRVPHHENLYIQCKQLISEDLQPVTIETAVYLAALQLHIETLSDSTLNHAFMEGQKGKKESRVYLNHLKHALPAWCFRVKNISKKVREKLNDFEGLSERNAKHMYIDKCQTTPGYRCSFYNVKVPNGGKFRRGNMSQLLGISDQEIVFLEDKTRDFIASYQLNEIQNVYHTAGDACAIVIQLVGGNSLMFHVDRESVARQIEIILDNFGQKVLQDIEREDLDDWVANWGTSPSSLHTSGGIHEEESQSTHSSAEKIKEFEETIMPITREEETQDMTTPTTVKANETPNSLLTPHNGQHENSFHYPDTKFDEKPSFCDCPPDPEIPLHIDIHLLSLQEILLHPLEVARQATLIDHERLCYISREELMQRAGLYPRRLFECAKPTHNSSTTSVPPHNCEGIEKLAHRFNQLGNWIVHSILQYTQEEDRGWVIQQFITTARYCMNYRNFSSTMAIVVAGLCSPPIRRLKKTWEHVSKAYKDELEDMVELLSSKNNYKNYREIIEKTTLPAVPYFGIFTRDLTFIQDGNPEYLRNFINLHKRRQLYSKLEEIRRFQTDQYNFEPVYALQEVLMNHIAISEEELHAISHSLEPSQRTQSNLDNRGRSSSVNSLTNLGFLKHSLTSKTSGSSSNLLNV